MTEREAIEALKLINTSRVHPFYSWEEMCDVRDIAIKALEEIRQYREMGTLEELKTASRYIHLAKRHETTGEVIDKCVEYEEIGTVEEFRKAKIFKEYFDELYGTGLEIVNWHKNGDTEPFDSFYDAAIDWSEEE